MVINKNDYMKRYSYLLFVFVFTIYGCKKEKNKITELKGKVKSMEFITYGTDTIRSKYFFKYDSISGNLVSVISNNRICILLQPKTNNYIDIEYYLSAIDTTLPATYRNKFRAYLTASNYISKIVLLDTIYNTEKEIINYYVNSAHYLDSVRVKNSIFNGFTYNYSYSWGNIKSVSRNLNSFLSISSDSSICFYNSQSNKDMFLYLEDILVNSEYFYLPPHLVLGINNYFAFKSNINFIDSIYTYHSGGGSPDYESQSSYLYDFNSDGQPRRIALYNRIINSTWKYSNQYNFEYY